MSVYGIKIENGLQSAVEILQLPIIFHIYLCLLFCRVHVSASYLRFVFARHTVL